MRDLTVRVRWQNFLKSPNIPNSYGNESFFRRGNSEETYNVFLKLDEKLVFSAL